MKILNVLKIPLPNAYKDKKPKVKVYAVPTPPNGDDDWVPGKKTAAKEKEK
jgi:hypothetical protein